MSKKRNTSKTASSTRAPRRPRQRSAKDGLVGKLLSIDDLKDVVGGGHDSGCECTYCICG
ncbi:MAG TPA: hypothetical protein VFU21_26695 [Kofleriaceae bacterium]|nr:hypothetical protein [Kofleriaceae bacterium]